MKTVFTNAMCAHVWAQLKQPHGRSGSMKFDGSVAYSYDTPVANIITPQGRAPVALFLPNRWGVTTAGHLREYRSAAAQLLQFEVPDIFTYDARLIRDAEPDASLHARNVKALTANYQKERDALLRVPADSWRVADNATETDDSELGLTRAHDRLRSLADVLDSYARAFGIECDPLPWSADADKAIARRDRLLNDPKAAAKRAARAAARAAEVAERDAKARADAAEDIRAWRAGADVHLSWASRTDENGGAMLRVIGDKVQTSQGADVPASHVRRVLAFYRYAKRPWKRTTEFEARDLFTLGHFTLDSIDADGNVRAGCHLITAAEVARIAATLANKE